MGLTLKGLEKNISEEGQQTYYSQRFHWQQKQDLQVLYVHLRTISTPLTDLPFLGTLFGICQELGKPGFWDVTGSFIQLTQASLADSRTLL